MHSYIKRWGSLAFAVTALMAPCAMVAAQDQPAKAEAQTAAKQPEQPKKEEPKKDPKVEEYEKAIKDLKKFDGAFTLYLRKKDVLLELPESNLDKVWLMQATMNTGISSFIGQAGDPLNSTDAYIFRKNDEQVWLIRPNFRYRWTEKDPLAIASQRSFPEAVLAGYRIEATNPEKKLLLVNVTGLFNGELLRLGELVNIAAGGQYSLDREKSGVESVKSFDQNTVVRMSMLYSSGRPMMGGGQEGPGILGIPMADQLEDQRSAPFKVTYNLWYRKDTGYMPRLSDPRVGYFTQDFYSLDRFLNRDRTERFIMRFDVRKKDPKAAMSEPLEPLVWYIDNSVPVEYRGAVRDGILFWNRAFEEIGIKNAIVVKQAPENDPNWDHADGRYNVLRWTMSEDAGYAVALFRTDPFTGQILNAAVTFDANMLYYAQLEQQMVSWPAAAMIPKAMQALTRSEGARNLVAELRGDSTVQRRESVAKAGKLGWYPSDCSFASGLAENAAFSWAAINAAGGKLALSKEEYAKKFITEVVSHEVGHCLGLRHNFVASTNLTTAQLADDSLVADKGVTASVMDYVPVNVQAVLRGSGYFYTPTIGPYDRWAIKYGYSEFGSKTTNGERSQLMQIASQSAQPGHAYMTDEDADDFDPNVVRFDGGKDGLNYARKMLEVSRRVRNYALKNLPKTGQSYTERNMLLNASLGYTFRQGQLASRYIGGVQGSRSFKGDPGAGPTLKPTDAKTQRDALSLIVRECLSINAMDVPQDVLLSMNRDYANGDASGWTAPLREIIGGNQVRLLALLLSAPTTDRIAENSFKLAKGDAYTLAEHYGTLLGAVFTEVGASKNISPIRRDVQRFMLNALSTQASAAPGAVSEDVRMIAGDSLRRLNARFTQQLGRSRGLDAMTLAHLRDMKAQSGRFLARSVSGAR